MKNLLFLILTVFIIGCGETPKELKFEEGEIAYLVETGKKCVIIKDSIDLDGQEYYTIKTLKNVTLVTLYGIPVDSLRKETKSDKLDDVVQEDKHDYFMSDEGEVVHEAEKCDHCLELLDL